MATNRVNRSALIYGPSGAWKTSWLAWAHQEPRTGPLLLLDFEGGGISVQGSGTVTVKIDSIDDLSEQYARCLEGGEYELFNGDTEKIETHKYSNFRSVAIDSASEIFAQLMLNQGEDRAELLKKEGGRRANPNILEQADWGIILMQARRMFRLFRSLDKNFFITSLSKTDLVPGEGNVRMPAIGGQFSEELPGMFTYTIYLSQYKPEKKDEDASNKRIMVLNDTLGVRARCRGKWGQTIPSSIVFGKKDNPVTLLYDVLQIKKEE